MSYVLKPAYKERGSVAGLDFLWDNASVLAQASHLQTKIFYVYVVVTYMEKTVLHSEVSGLFLRLDAPKKT